MKNYITKEQKDTTKTYNKYVDILVRFEDGGTQYPEKLTGGKSNYMDQIYCIVGSRKIKAIEVKNTFYRLKDKWSY